MEEGFPRNSIKDKGNDSEYKFYTWTNIKNVCLLFCMHRLERRTEEGNESELASFADVLWALFPPTNVCSTEYEIPFLKTDQSQLADIEVGFVNVCDKFGIRALNDYQREAIT